MIRRELYFATIAKSGFVVGIKIDYTPYSLDKKYYRNIASITDYFGWK